jgi:hypothetical protein
MGSQGIFIDPEQAMICNLRQFGLQLEIENSLHSFYVVIGNRARHRNGIWVATDHGMLILLAYNFK